MHDVHCAPRCVVLDQHRIAELVRPVPTSIQLHASSIKNVVARECAQQLVMAGLRLVRPRYDHIDHTKLPLLPGTLDYSRKGFCAGGLTSNEQFFGKYVSLSDSITPEMRNVLFDPQTSGGLLIFCHPPDAETLLQNLRADKIPAVEIGFTSDLSDLLLTVT